MSSQSAQPVSPSLDAAVTAAFSEGHEPPAERAPVDLDSISGARAYLHARMCGPGGVLGGPSGGGLMGHALNTLLVHLDRAVEGVEPEIRMPELRVRNDPPRPLGEAIRLVPCYRVEIDRGPRFTGSERYRGLIVVAADILEAAVRAGADARDIRLDDYPVMLPPAPPPPAPELPAKVFSLVGYGTPRTVGLSAHPRDLAHLIHVDERAAFMRAAGDQPWDGDRLERLWQLERKGADGRVDFASLEVVEPLRSGLVGPALSSVAPIPQAMRAALREQTPAFAAEIEAKFQAAGADGRADMAAFFESDGPRKVAEAKAKIEDGTPTSADLVAQIARPPARQPVDGELTREALLADADPKRRVRTLKFVRLHTLGSIGENDEFRLIDPKRSSIPHAGLVAPHERRLVISAGFFEVDLEDFTACVTDEMSRSLDTGPLPDGEDNEALHAFLWPEASTSSEVRS